MATPHHTRRSDTRRRIQDVALELFAEQGYEKTSLREIAERLDVTKAALYYHFKTKEDILVSISEGFTAPIDELIAWAQAAPRTLATRQELLRRYSVALAGGAELFRFFQENQATVRDLAIGEAIKSRLTAVSELLKEPGSPLRAQVRSLTALFAMHAGMFALQSIDGDPEEKRSAILDVALDLITEADAEMTAGHAG
jgi:AcrR family transcriptional regulator